MSDDILKNMIEIKLIADDSFNIIRETLTRIGVRHPTHKKLYQTAHILHKRGHFYICHFKEMFLLDGKEADITEEDLERRNTIANLLEQWKLLEILKDDFYGGFIDMNQIKIVPFKEKKEWELIPKYTIGNRK